jgi:MATE family multidrug resistance protein
LRWVAIEMFSAPDAVERVTRGYFDLRIWGAPATLSLFALMGVLIGLGLSKQLLFVQLFMNGLNIALDLLFAGVFDMGAPGVALGTALAEWTTLALGLLIVSRALNARSRAAKFVDWPEVLRKEALASMLSSNVDIMIRTLLLILSFAFFADQSARYGEVISGEQPPVIAIGFVCRVFSRWLRLCCRGAGGKSARRGQTWAISPRGISVDCFSGSHCRHACAIVVVWRHGAHRLAYRYRRRARSLCADAWIRGRLCRGLVRSISVRWHFIGLSATREMRNASIHSIVVYFVACRCSRQHSA